MKYANWVLDAALLVMFISALAMIHNRDARIAQLEASEKECRAVKDGDLAVQSYSNGVLECVIHSGKSGNRTLARKTI